MTRYARNRERLSALMLELGEFTTDELIRKLRRRYDGDIAIDPLQTIPEQLEEFRGTGLLHFEYPRYIVPTQ